MSELENFRNEVKELKKGYETLEKKYIDLRDSCKTHSTDWNFFAGKRGMISFVISDLEELLK